MSDTVPQGALLTELLLFSIAMQIDPDLAARAELDARVLLVVESIEGATDHRVQRAVGHVSRQVLRVFQ